ncbi:peroxidasin homolog [Glandiceps talaboti]
MCYIAVLIFIGGLFVIAGYAVEDAYPKIGALKVAIKNATVNVEQAVQETQETLESFTPITPGDFLTIFKYPSMRAAAMIKTEDVVETVMDIMKSNEIVDGEIKPINGHGRKLTTEERDQVVHQSGCLVNQLAVEKCASALIFNTKYRTVDGTCNNFRQPDRGSAFQPLRRLLHPIYEDDYSTPVGWNPEKLYNNYLKPNPRAVSTDIATSNEVEEHKFITAMNVVWGQFLAHDMQFTVSNPSHVSFTEGVSCKEICENLSPCFPIPLPLDDRRRPEQTCLEFTRSGAVCGTGNPSSNGKRTIYRQQLTAVSSYIDASHIYGSTNHIELGRRDMDSHLGFLAVGEAEAATGRPLMPLDPSPAMKCFAEETRTVMGPCFVAGDVRANEIPTLTSLHTLWTREHNRIATALANMNYHWDSDTLYQEAKSIVQAEFEHITYTGYLPSIFGPSAMMKLGTYTTYNNKIDSTAINVFATAAFRFAHGLVSPIMARLDTDFQPIAEGNIHLHEGFFQPWRIIEEGGIDPIIRGLFAVGAKDLNPSSPISDELTEHLFETADELSLDLHALDIQRGRDHALPEYNTWRKYCGLKKAETFSEFTEISNSTVRGKLQEHYGHPDNVDLFIGALLEDPIGGSVMGPTFECLLVKQFRRSRNGDRFWYENPDVLSYVQLKEIKKSTLSRIICDNTNIERVQKDVFLKVNDEADYINCIDIPSVNLTAWRHDNSDKESPVLKCPDDINQAMPPRKKKVKVHWNLPIVTDNMNGNITIISTRDSGDPFYLGITKVSYSAVDSSGNGAVCSFSVAITENLELSIV